MKSIKALLFSAMLAASGVVFGATFSYVAPSAPTGSTSFTTITSVVDSVKSVSTAFNFTDSAAIATLDNAANTLAMAIKIQDVSTGGVSMPAYNSASGAISWSPNLSSMFSSGNILIQSDSAGYDAAATSFRDYAGNFATQSIIEGGSGINRLLVSVDGIDRTVNGSSYSSGPDSITALISAFNNSTTFIEKDSYLVNLLTKLSLVQAQAAAIETQGQAAIDLMNNYVLPEAGRGSASFGSLSDLFTYHGMGVM